jgi:hypothetical protein
LLTFAISFFFLPGIGSGQNWTGEGGDNLWDNPDNWDTFTLPTAADETRINWPGAEDNPPLIEEGIDAVVSILISDFGTASMSMTGGTLECAGWGSWWGDAAGSECVFNMSGGTVDFTGSPGILELAWQGPDDPPGSSRGTWVISGGTVNAKGIDMPGKGGEGRNGAAEIHLEGGTLNVGTARGGLIMYDGRAIPPLIDITEGTLVLEGDETAKVEDFVDRGFITAYGGDGDVDYSYDNLSNSTTVTASPPVVGGIRPCDFNADGNFDLSDPVALLNHLFLGGAAPPCGDQTLAHPANVALLDANADGRLDLSDAVFDLAFLFLGGPAPAAGTSGDCVPIEGCPITCQP